MRNIFQRIPFIRITGLFLAGILFAHFFYPETRFLAVLFVAIAAIQIAGWYSQDYKFIRVQNILISLALFILGAFYYNQIDTSIQKKLQEKNYFLAEVCQKPGEKAKSFQTILLIRNQEFPKPEKILAYFSKEGFDSAITTGDQLMILAKLQPIKNAGNPFEFDYRSLLQQRNIRHSVYLARGTYLKTNRHTINWNNWAEKIRDRLVSQLHQILPDQEGRSVVSALTLGYRTELDQDTLDYFASTGAMHVLSVSGLHVALIYFILGFLLSFLKKGKAGRFAFSAIMLGFLWGYAIISGFSPPVQRATIMFTFVIVGENMRRPVNIFNSLAASALFLILLNPNVVFDVGFQLSYLAIFGIILIQPLLFNLLTLENQFLKWAWALFTVSIAAQIMTFPLGFYYFNQFPNLFWLSNFVVIPITTLIMWLTLAYFIVLPLHGLASIIGIGIQKLTALMLFVLKEIDHLPFAVTEGVVLSNLELGLLFGCIFTLLIFAFSKQKVWLFTFLGITIVFQLACIQEKMQVFNQNKVIVYNTKSRMIHLISGRKNYIITDDYTILSEKEIAISERVGNHLFLDKPQFISLKNQPETNNPELRILGPNIIFGSAKIRLMNSKELPGKSEYLELSIRSRQTNKPFSKTLVYSVQPAQEQKNSSVYFSTKESGAFIADLEN